MCSKASNALRSVLSAITQITTHLLLYNSTSDFSILDLGFLSHDPNLNGFQALFVLEQNQIEFSGFKLCGLSLGYWEPLYSSEGAKGVANCSKNCSLGFF